MNDFLNNEGPKPIKFKKGQVLYVEGEPSNYVYLIKSGIVKLIKEDAGRLVAIARLKDKEFIGLESFFSDSSRKESAVAVEETNAFMIKRNDLKGAMKTCPEWMNDLISLMSGRLENTMDILRAHRISDDLEQGFGFGQDEEVKIKKSLEEYKKKKGL
ncbi:cyclic nucleotide-binding domain protein [Bacteriovorax sp. BSW11_IV]|uniref:Crp/Fnr family transcriptional regulator n=1 Tax=Bacteriovorax sp. BSW11_IV TaxID=1353529 RepID=UPI00038A052A|nr:cyclic nucleotide-binding domain-containing protein [Bacteriovorax sp. BSW11_IV]EQC47081.1 cyclic nucleotide-binding domain protein [Bacteriovorax sp. BSW11_IV]